MALSVTLEHAQRRVAADRLTLAAAGMELDGSVWAATWIDPVTKALMLRPAVMDNEWYRSSTGAYSKLGLSAFSSVGSRFC